MGIGAAPAAGGRVMVSVFDGRRQPFTDGSILVTVIDGHDNLVTRKTVDVPNTLFDGLPLFDNPGDDYRILASAPGYKDAGFFPVPLKPHVTRLLNLMLIPESNEINFGHARWADVRKKKPRIHKVLADTTDDKVAKKRYSDLEDFKGGEVLACVLNLLTACDQVHLRHDTPLAYLKSLIWESDGDSKLARDRCFAWADADIVSELAGAKDDGALATAPFALHPGATGSYKQTQFGEANLQFTLHENDKQILGGVECIKIELDVDYFKDPLSHLLLEVAVNALGNVTDPRAVYALRWIAGQRAGLPEFDPLYTIEKA